MNEKEKYSKYKKYYQNYRKVNRKQQNEYARKKRAENPALWNKRSNISKHKNWTEYLIKNRKSGRDSRFKLRQKAVNSIGGCCAKCGFSDIRALQIDHINGDGFVERRNRKQNQWIFYKNIIKFGSQGKYQVLCANCNWIKVFENKEFSNKIKEI